MNQVLKAGQFLQNGTYRIEKVLGQGTFGITYLAKAKITTQGNLGKMVVDAPVAIKEFFMKDVNNRRDDGSSVDGSSGNVFTNYRKKFKKEAENLSKLSHPNIVKVLDVFDENNTTYYVMEFLEGSSLHDYIDANGPLSLDKCRSVVNEIGAALIYMHSRKMLHLDIKPKNMMCCANGKFVLIDFGLSKQFSENGEPESSTMGLGTAGYAPLEQASYKADQQGNTFPATLDVYALGASVFKMLTGNRAPEASDILNIGFPDDELRRCNLPESTFNAIKRAMAPARKDRTRDIKTLLNELGCSDNDQTLVAEAITHLESELHSNDTKDSKTTNNTSNTSYTSNSGSYTPSPVVEQFDKEDSDTEQPGKLKWILIALAAVVCGIAVWWFVGNSGSDSSDEADDPDTTLTEVPSVNNMEWLSPLGKSSYTGEVVVDPKDNDNQIPHGHGVATITEGEFKGAVYDGDFEWGQMSGSASYTLANGDTFVGTFKDNKFDKGTYTVKSSGDYYVGDFKDGQPSGTTWYDRNGKRYN